MAAESSGHEAEPEPGQGGGAAAVIRRGPPRTRPLALAAVALVVGTVVGLGGAESVLPAASALTLGIGGAGLFLRRRELVALAALSALATGGLHHGLSAVRSAERDCRLLWEAGAGVSLTGRALGFLPAGVQGSVRVAPLSAASGCRWSGALRLWADGPIRPGRLYAVSGAWQPARTPGRGPRAPERTGWVVAGRIEPVGESSWTRHPFLNLRGRLAQRLWGVYPARWAPLAEALVLGQRETLRPEVSRRIARAGLAHLLAISGLHVGLLAAAFYSLARITRLSPGWARSVTVVVTCAYVVLIGAPASAVRAALMVILWTLTRLAGRASSGFDVLGLAAVFLLSARPWSALEAGFQLSFAGAAAVAYAHSQVGRSPWLREQPWVLRSVAVSALTSVAAVLITAPITATHFGRIAPAAIVGNLLAVPLLTLAMPALFLSALLSPWLELASWPAAAAVTLLRGIDLLARLLSSLRWASLDVVRPGLPLAVGCGLLLLLGAHALHGAWQRRRFIYALGLLVAFTIAWPPLRARLGPDQLAVYVIDVGQGDAIAIATPRRHWILVDAGPKRPEFDAGRRAVLPFLREQGVRRVEAFLASHPDLDHVGGAPAVLEAMEVSQVMGSGRVTGQVGQLAVLRWLAKNGMAWTLAGAGARLSLDEVELRFLHPDAGQLEAGSEAPNENSIVFLLEFGEFRMLFTGDAPGKVEDRLSQESGEELRAQVLKVAHHGSASSTSRFLLRTVQPELAVISVGRGNVYGHPSPFVLGRLGERGIELRRTDRDGTVVIEARRDGTWRARSAAEGYW